MVDGSRSLGRAAAPEDVPAVSACLTSAFYDDPVWGRWTFPEEASRVERVYELMRFWCLAGERHSWVRMTENAEAVAVWIPPGEPELTMEEETAFGLLLTQLLGSRADEVQGLLDRFDEHHPKESHYYLSLWATHRNHAGRGIGTELLNENLSQIDAERMPAYLESTNPANLQRYERSGFRRRGEFEVADGPVITTMWREAR